MELTLTPLHFSRGQLWNFNSRCWTKNLRGLGIHTFCHIKALHGTNIDSKFALWGQLWNFNSQCWTKNLWERGFHTFCHIKALHEWRCDNTLWSLTLKSNICCKFTNWTGKLFTHYFLFSYFLSSVHHQSLIFFPDDMSSADQPDSDSEVADLQRSTSADTGQSSWNYEQKIFQLSLKSLDHNFKESVLKCFELSISFFSSVLCSYFGGRCCSFCQWKIPRRWPRPGCDQSEQIFQCWNWWVFTNLWAKRPKVQFLKQFTWAKSMSPSNLSWFIFAIWICLQSFPEFDVPKLFFF